MSTFNKKIRSILTQKRGMSSEVVDNAIQEAVAEEKSLVDVLVAKEVIEEKELVGLIASESGFPPIDPHRLTVDEDLL
ncbi:MAG: hypothetical protein ABIK28_19670, partial [Planctomycetota bacterium]